MRLTAFLVTAAALAPAQVFLDEKQAAELVLSGCESTAREEKQLSADDRAALEKETGLRFPAPRYTFLVGKRQDQVCGYAVVLEEIGKSEPITFMVGVDPDGRAGEVALMVFRESRGAEVRDRRFTRQFKGKRLKDPIRVNQDILSYTGATLSSEAMARGVKKALALVTHFYLKPRTRAAYVMGTIATVKLYAPDEASAQKHAAAVFKELRRLDDLFTRYRDSELTRMNREAADSAVPVSPEMFELLRASLEYSQKYSGVFDVTLGTGPDGLILDERSRTVRFRQRAIQVDLDGVAKGYAAERAARLLASAGVERALVSLGESSLFALGPPPGRSGWPVAVVDPQRRGRVATVIELPPFSALSTSAAARLIDPRTRKPARVEGSATAVCASGAESEAAAKAVLLGVATDCRCLLTLPIHDGASRRASTLSKSSVVFP